MEPGRVSVWILWTFALFVLDSRGQLAPDAPVLVIPERQAVTTVHETEATGEDHLVRPITCTSPVGNPVRVFLQSISPPVACSNCFAVWPDSKVYALYYLPGLGQLNYDLVSSYTLQLQCTDGVSSAVASMEVRLQPNSPPVFKKRLENNYYDNWDVSNTDNKPVGNTIYEVSAEDPDGDAVFYRMETVPATDLFEIGRSDGIIRTTSDLRYLCRTNADFKVWTFDDHNTHVGPRVVKVNFRGGTDRPTITNKDTVIELEEHPEDKNFNAEKEPGLLEIKTIPSKASKYKWRVRAEPERGLEYYNVEIRNDNVKIRVLKRLDYEYEPLRSVTLHMVATDGFCESEPYSVRIDLKDVNEPPVISPFVAPPGIIERTVYEGVITFHPNVTFRDPDLDENIKWKLSDDASGAFRVDPDTGTIYSIGEIDIDGNKDEFKIRNLELAVVDKKGDRDKVSIKLTVLDSNDNPPEFKQTLVRTAATECSPVGKDLAKLVPTDVDSQFQGNSRTVITGRGTNLTVTATGHVILMNQCTAGDKETFTVYVEDQGVYPQPLKGVPSTVTFECKVCPPPPPTTAAATTPAGGGGGGGGGGGNNGGSNGGSSTGGDGTNNNDDDDDDSKDRDLRRDCQRQIYRRKHRQLCRRHSLQDLQGGGYSNGYDFVGVNAGWMVSSIVLTAVFLALLLSTVWRYCWHGVKAARPGVKRAPKPRVVKPKPPKPQPPPQQPPPPPPPPQLEPYNEPRMFGFWKETFPDRDQRHMPQRNTLPMNVAQDSKIDQQNKVEEFEERQQWRQERLQQVQRFQQELQQYSQQQGQPPPDASAYWYTGTTDQAVRGGTGDTILPNRQWAAKPAGGEDSAPSPGQGGAEQPAPHPSSSNTARHLSHPALQAWYGF